MIIIEHKDYIRRVRDDQALEHVACVPCKGRGFGYACIGAMGNLAYYGWSMHAFQQRGCGHCGGMGAWREPGITKNN